MCIRNDQIKMINRYTVWKCPDRSRCVCVEMWWACCHCGWFVGMTELKGPGVFVYLPRVCFVSLTFDPSLPSVTLHFLRTEEGTYPKVSSETHDTERGQNSFKAQDLSVDACNEND